MVREEWRRPIAYWKGGFIVVGTQSVERIDTSHVCFPKVEYLGSGEALNSFSLLPTTTFLRRCPEENLTPLLLLSPLFRIPQPSIITRKRDLRKKKKERKKKKINKLDLRVTLLKETPRLSRIKEKYEI